MTGRSRGMRLACVERHNKDLGVRVKSPPTLRRQHAQPRDSRPRRFGQDIRLALKIKRSVAKLGAKATPKKACPGMRTMMVSNSGRERR